MCDWLGAAMPSTNTHTLKAVPSACACGWLPYTVPCTFRICLWMAAIHCTLNPAPACMKVDGCHGSGEGEARPYVMVLAATNFPWDIDEAMRRCGEPDMGAAGARYGSC